MTQREGMWLTYEYRCHSTKECDLAYRWHSTKGCDLAVWCNALWSSDTSWCGLTRVRDRSFELVQNTQEVKKQACCNETIQNIHTLIFIKTVDAGNQMHVCRTHTVSGLPWKGQSSEVMWKMGACLMTSLSNRDCSRWRVENKRALT